MGQAISCFDSAKEHPPYSWPKDHPERESAIAEQKRKRKQRIVGVGGGAHTVELNSKPVGTSPTPLSDPVVAAPVEPSIDKPAAVISEEIPKVESVDVDTTKVSRSLDPDVVDVPVIPSEVPSLPTDPVKTDEPIEDIAMPEEPQEIEVVEKVQVAVETVAVEAIPVVVKNSDDKLAEPDLDADSFDDVIEPTDPDVDLHVDRDFKIDPQVDPNSDIVPVVEPTVDLATNIDINPDDNPDVVADAMREDIEYVSNAIVDEALQIMHETPPNVVLAEKNTDSDVESLEDIDQVVPSSDPVDVSEPVVIIEEPKIPVADEVLSDDVDASIDAMEKEPVLPIENDLKPDENEIPVDGVDASELSSIDTRRAIFDSAEDHLPEVKELRRDVLDPVTNEYISLEEYRKRQMDRAQGVVRERVEKFEGIDEERSRQIAEHNAIEAARTEAIVKASWSFKRRKWNESTPERPMFTKEDLTSDEPLPQVSIGEEAALDPAEDDVIEEIDEPVAVKESLSDLVPKDQLDEVEVVPERTKPANTLSLGEHGEVAVKEAEEPALI